MIMGLENDGYRSVEGGRYRMVLEDVDSGGHQPMIYREGDDAWLGSTFIESL